MRSTSTTRRRSFDHLDHFEALRTYAYVKNGAYREFNGLGIHFSTTTVEPLSRCC